MLYVYSSKRCRIEFASKKISSKSLYCRIKYLIYQMITNFSNELRLKTKKESFYVDFFSQEILYKLKFSKNISKLVRNKLSFYVILAFSHFLLHLLSNKRIRFEQFFIWKLNFRWIRS